MISIFELLKTLKSISIKIKSIEILLRDEINKLFYIDFLFDVIIKKSDFNIYLL